jgi:catechol 2,3-dioxygenase-like lactoylglutathione lyase family enzyme
MSDPNPSIISHVSVGARDVPKALAFYDPVMAALGAKRVMDHAPYAVGYGGVHPEFWVQVPNDGKPASPGNGVHICFNAASRKAVDAFYRIALQHGGKDAGPPGLRPDYMPDYYAAFVYDLDGNKLEAVTFGA